MILEGLITSVSNSGVWNVAPMGPLVDETLSHLVLRPFQTSTTCQNLQQTRCGVLHVVDDVLILAQAAIGRLTEFPPHQPAVKIPGRVLTDACRWFEFEVTEIDDSQPRVTMQARVVHSEHLRDFFGFNRAKHAVLEAAILATRLHLLPAEEIRRDFERFAVIVQKTAGPRETAAFRLLEEYVRDHLSEPR
ncbi:MAG: DUF447 family protein [Planctomycetes bacterium]|nr:DUF447 family protein [Planctomycetota bacterium]